MTERTNEQLTNEQLREWLVFAEARTYLNVPSFTETFGATIRALLRARKQLVEQSMCAEAAKSALAATPADSAKWLEDKLAEARREAQET
jgi:hypothetical protein